jgi:hypothetical protein
VGSFTVARDSGGIQILDNLCPIKQPTIGNSLVSNLSLFHSFKEQATLIHYHNVNGGNQQHLRNQQLVI